MKPKLTEADFDSTGLLCRVPYHPTTPVDEADVSRAMDWIQRDARQAAGFKEAPSPVVDSVGYGAFAVAALRSGYRIKQEFNGSHSVLVNMLHGEARPRGRPRKDTNREGPDWDRLLTLAFEQGGRFSAAQAHTCNVSNELLRVHVQKGSFERIGHGQLRIATSEPLPEMAPAVPAYTHVGVLRATHARLLAQKQLSGLTIGQVIEKALDALEGKT